jgi:hypothetical protein
VPSRIALLSPDRYRRDTEHAEPEHAVRIGIFISVLSAPLR